MNFLALSGIINFITTISIAGLAFFRAKRSIRNVSFVLLNFSASVYSLGYFYWQFLGGSKSAIFSFKILFLGIVLVNLCYLIFVFTVVGILKDKMALILFHSILSVVFIFLSFSDLLYSSFEPRFGLGYWPKPKFLFNIYLIYWFYQCFYGYVLLFRGYLKSLGIEREQIKYFLIAAIFGFGGGATNWPLWYNINFPPYFNILIAVWVSIEAYAIVKYRLMDIRLAVSNTAIFIAVYALILGVPFIFGYKYHLWEISTWTMLILASIGPIVLQYFQQKARDNILHEEQRVIDVLIKTSNGLVAIRVLQQLLNLIVNVLIKSLNLNYTTVYLLDVSTNSYAINASYPLKASKNEVFVKDNIVLYLKEKKYPTIYEEVSHFSEGKNKENIKAKEIALFMQEMSAVVIIPLVGEKELLGFVILGERQKNKIYSPELISALTFLGNQVALALEIIMSMSERDKLLNENFQKSRFESLALLSTSVSHQMNNRFAGIINLLFEQWEILNENGYKEISNEEKVKLLDTIKDKMNRAMNIAEDGSKITKAILDFSKSRVDFGLVSFDEAIDKSIEFIQLKRSNCKIDLKKEYPKDVMLWAAQAPLHDILANAIDNSWFAMNLKKNHFNDPNYHPLIVIRGNANTTMFHFEIEDNGMGIKKDDLKKVLDPMFTTKGTLQGTGMGTTVMLQFIQKHGGSIGYESEHTQWTKVKISLPLATEEQKGRLGNV